MRENNLKKIRKQCALTQQQVADALKIERSTYTYYETGKTDPSISTLKKIIALFDSSFDEVYPGLESKLTEPFGDYVSPSDMTFSQLNKDEKELIVNYRLIKNDDKKRILEEILGMLSEREPE